ncbi:hypothetical protein K488DRAFT_42648 [Vararia minispora EC-137]|uniref:Uncharacterized protein n=1 Tax=Vararia minispora EC-137 TaxID=1314806 RepID=A0ACB8QV15_9AGAM|nr:hypothetical protein K488DRAFT_42648 [Vararia minispora EC-137]
MTPPAQQPSAASSSFQQAQSQNNGQNSGAGTPVSVTAQSVGSSSSAQQSTSRESAILSLLGTVSSSSNAPLASQQQSSSHQPSGTIPVNNENQGRMLLEQIMQGSMFLPPLPPVPPPVSGLAAQYPPSPYPPASFAQDQHETGSYYEPESVQPQDLHTHAASPPEAQQMTSPSPPKSMFDFVSPFDALSSGPTRKAIPSTQSGMPSAESQSWPAIDPKRASVDNLIEQLTRAHPPPVGQQVYDPHPPPPPPPANEPEPIQAKQARPLPPKPALQGSPRASPPKAPTMQNLGRDKDESPGPRGGWKGQEGRARGSGGKGKTQPSAAPQNIVFDVSQPLDELQAPRDAVKSTAIALVRVDSTFLPGTTIGATHWVAYAMTKGRIRVISRASGDRTLLQLPSVFPGTTAVTDMAVFGNRLAGITSDGGFVLWELPEVIMDDVPGRVVLCVIPQHGPEGLHSVKWHPKEENMLAVASESSVYILNVLDVDRAFGKDTIDQSELSRICRPMRMSSTLVALEFDIVHSAIATLFEDSTLTLHGVTDHVPFWQAKIKGEGAPSSITFVEGGLVIGRKHGTIFQLLSHMNSNVFSQIKFVNGDQEDPDMFGHANYDARIQTLWIANNRRDSMLAFKLAFDVSSPSRSVSTTRAFIDQVVEFAGPKPTIHFVILTADADPHGEEAHAACVAAKVPPGELALVAFSVHSTGVDQVLIRREWFDGALSTTLSKLPALPVKFPSPPTQPAPAPPPQESVRAPRQVQQPAAQVPLVQPVAHPSPVAPPRLRTPTSEEIEQELAPEAAGRHADGRGRGKGKNVGWKKGDDSDKGKAPETSGYPDAFNKEIKRLEESLHLRITRHINKELEKQHQRLEEVRVNEQAADFARQEKILKLISNELTKNTTRVVEMAVKTEVQNSVLPSLETITKNEVKLALNGQIAKGLGDTMNKALPNEIERLLLRPDVSAHVARTFSSAITPAIERHVKEAIHQTLIPTYQQQSSTMHQELAREMQAEMLNIKKEVIAWQSEALRGQEAIIRDLEQSVRSLSDQVKYLTLNVGVSTVVRRSSTPPSGPVVPYSQQPQAQALMRQAQPPPQQHTSYGPLPPPQQLAPPPSMQGAWFQSSIPAPQASHPALPPPTHHSPPTQAEEWDDTYLAVLGTQDPRQLRELLARSNPDIIMPLKGQSPLSQAVILTLVHRLSAAIGEISPVDESFKSSLWWLQRASAVLNTSDPIISPYVARVLPNVNGMLNTTKSRISIIPNAPQALDTARSIQDIQDILSRKPT